MSNAAPPASMLTGSAWLSTQPLGPAWWPAWAKAVTICPCMFGHREWTGCTDCYNVGLCYDWQPG